jgi:oxaloacetate decarboxylase alpha subunit
MAEDRRIKITDTTLRDGHQSLLATRLKIEDILPICRKIDEVGFFSLEVWGGATFDTCLRFLDEDPWERLILLRQHLKTPLQMLLRGQNIVGYKNYPDDVLTEFIKRAFYHGISIFRIFDALNDIRNLSRSIEVVKQEGAHAQATVVYTISPVHNVAYYLKIAHDLVEMGADSICLKDMAGILTPQVAFEIFKTWKESLKVPLQVHSHYTGGFASMSYIKAIEAGVDIIDCAISSLALQTSQPATETMVMALKGTPYDPGLNLTVLSEIAVYFQKVRKHYLEFDLAAKNIDPNVIIYQLPGGMISNFISQLTQQNALDKLSEVLAELPRVREDLGYPPLVTPTSQIIGTQAVFNVLFGHYKMPSTETKQYLRGYYGLPPGPVNEEVRQMVIGNEKPITCRPADLLPPGLEKAREEATPYSDKLEDVISVALFPQAAICFLKKQQTKKASPSFNLFSLEEDNGIHYI